jgi:hypothetical protein
MPGWKSLFGAKFLVVLLFTLSAGFARARNAVQWNYINLPEAGGPGDTVQFVASVTNQGDAAWTGNHYIEARDGNGTHLSYVSVAGTAPGSACSAVFTLKLPAKPGTLTYVFTALHHGVEYFGPAQSRTLNLPLDPALLPSLKIEPWNFPAGGGKRPVSLSAVRVGDVVTITSASTLTAGTGWRHNILIRRPAITSAVATPPEDGSGIGEAEAWNKDGWGNPFTDGNSYNASISGTPAADLGNREPFVHLLATGQKGSKRSLDFVLDAPGTWLIRAEVVDVGGRTLTSSATTALNVTSPALAGDPLNITYPYGRADRFVGVFWNAGQAHRLWSTWRASYDYAYRTTWAVNWKLMWQPSPYFAATGGGWLRPEPAADSPWQAFWSAHQVYPIVPDGLGGSRLTHDVTSLAFAEKAALRLMDIGADFVAVDYTNQFLESREDVFPALNNLALGFQNVATRSQSGQRVKLTAVVPANVASGDWGGNGGFVPVAIARFNAKLTTLYDRFARFESAWFYLEDDNGVRKPLLLLWVGASGEAEADGSLAREQLAQLRLTDGRALSEVFTVRWVGAFLENNRRFLTGANYAVWTGERTVAGKYARAKLWSYRENHPSTATIMRGATGAIPAVEAITVQPVSADRDRFGRAWNMNWPASQGYHYETPATTEPVPLGNYGKAWAEALLTARALNPKFLLTTWSEFGSENDEPRPELSVTIMDNNKFGTHFGDALKQAVRLFKYREPTVWIDAFTVADSTQLFSEIGSKSFPSLHADQSVRLQGWVTPNVATTFAGGSVKVFVDDQLRGTAIVGGAWNNATRWHFDLPMATLSTGTHTVKVLAEDGIGGSSLAGVQFRGEAPGSVLSLSVGSSR